MKDLLLDETVLAHIHHKRISLGKSRGLHPGQHKSVQRGFNAEFSQHARYNPGDEIRSIDWRLYGRNEKLFIKQYEHDSNYSVHMLLDTSASMAFQGSGSVAKFNYVRSVASHLAYLFLRQQDLVHIYACSEALMPESARLQSRKDIPLYLDFLAAMECGGEFNPAASLAGLAERLGEGSVVFIFSDFWTGSPALIRGLHALGRAQAVYCLHFLDPSEAEMDSKRNTVFVDMESNRRVRANPSRIRKMYTQLFNEHLNTLQKVCEDNGCRYIRLSPAQGLIHSLNYLIGELRRSDVQK